MPVQQNREVGGVYPIRVLLAFVLIPIGTSTTVSAQDAEQSPAAPTETIEEIVAYGDKSMNTLRQAVFRAEENFFDLFSSLNDDDDFDIRCFYETPTGTHIRRHVCRANFVTDATSAEAATFRTRGPRYPVQDARTVIMLKKRVLREKMETLISSNPELLEAVNNYTNAKQEYVCERKRKVEDKILDCQQ